MSSEFDVIGSTVKVSGEAPLPSGVTYDHDEEIYVVGKVAVKEVSFPEDKDGNIFRVHRAKLSQAFVVDPEGAESLIVQQREALTGQGNLLAELQRMNDAGDNDE